MLLQSPGSLGQQGNGSFPPCQVQNTSFAGFTVSESLAPGSQVWYPVLATAAGPAKAAKAAHLAPE